MKFSHEARGVHRDVFSWIIVFSLIVISVIGNNYFSSESLLYRLIAILILAGSASFVSLQTTKGKAFFILAKAAKNEIRRVVWPSRQETAQITLTILMVVIFISVVLWGVDSLLGLVVSSVIGWGSFS